MTEDVSGLVERFDASAIMFSLDGIPPKPSANGAWVRYDALASLSLQLAAVEGKRESAWKDYTKYLRLYDSEKSRADTAEGLLRRVLQLVKTRGDLQRFYDKITGLEAWDETPSPQPSEAKSLSAAQEENERLAAEVEALTHNPPPPSPHLRTVEEVGDPTAWLFHEKPPSTHVRVEPAGYLVKRYDLNGVWLDTELSFTKPVIRSTCKTEFVPLYAGRATLSTPSKEDKTDAE